MTSAISELSPERSEGRTWGTPGAPATIPLIRDGVKQKAWLCGTADDVIDGIRSIEAKYPGLEDFMIHWAEGLSAGEFREQSLPEVPR